MGKMEIPKVEEIAEYCRDRNNEVDPEYFYDYYQSIGWMVGKHPMKDWQAAVRTWEHKDRIRKEKSSGLW